MFDQIILCIPLFFIIDTRNNLLGQLMTPEHFKQHHNILTSDNKNLESKIWTELLFSRDKREFPEI